MTPRQPISCSYVIAKDGANFGGPRNTRVREMRVDLRARMSPLIAGGAFVAYIWSWPGKRPEL